MSERSRSMVALVVSDSATVKWRGSAVVFTPVNPCASKVVRSATQIAVRVLSLSPDERAGLQRDDEE
jgi:hypothetical protein